MRWRWRLRVSAGRSTSGNPRQLPECTSCQETLPEIQRIPAPTDSRPRNRLLYRPAMTSKRPNSTGSRLYSATADRAEPPGRAFKLTRGNQRTSTPRRGACDRGGAPSPAAPRHCAIWPHPLARQARLCLDHNGIFGRDGPPARHPLWRHLEQLRERLHAANGSKRLLQLERFLARLLGHARRIRRTSGLCSTNLHPRRFAHRSRHGVTPDGTGQAAEAPEFAFAWLTRTM